MMASRRAVDARGPAAQAREHVRERLRTLGWSVREVREGGVTYLDATQASGRHVRVRTKARTGGTWQATVTSGSPHPVRPTVPTFWAFVDLTALPVAFYLVEDGEMRRDIHRVHTEYLARNAGGRARNDESMHHAIGVERVAHGRDRWRLLEQGVS